MSGYGLVRVVPGDKMIKNEAPEELPQVFGSELERHIRRQWEINRDAKIRVENELLEDLRAKNCEYGPQKLQQIRMMGGSEIYMGLTATKQRAAASWIKDIIMPEDDKSWGIEPTPEPDLPKWAEDAAVQRVMEMGGDVGQLQQLRHILRLELNEQAQKSAENMERKINDQLLEGQWGHTITQLIDDFCTFSACVLKGPMLKKNKKLTWKQGFGRMSPKIKDEIEPRFERVSPFDCYPSPEAETPNDGNFIEHCRFKRGTLYNMIGVPGYKEQEIRNVLEDYEHGLRDWLWNDQLIQDAQNQTQWWRRGREGLIDGLHYWGSVQGKHLKEWGMEGIEDELAEYQVDAILIGKYVIRCVINNDPLARRPYMKACYDPIPGGFWGNSIRYLMRDIQEFCNATARSLVNNMAMASGPQVEVNYERLSPLENELEVYPWKIWQTRGSEVGGSNAVQFFQPNSNAAELMAVYEQFERRADDATSIPRYSHGNEKVGGAGSTASGLSMLLNSAAKGIKAAITNFDFGVTRPAIEQLYFYNMITTKDTSIQGDARIVARGANALLLKDMAQQRRNEFLQLTSNEMDMQIIGQDGRSDLLRNIAKDAKLEGIVPDREVIRARMEEAAQNPPPDPEQIKQQAETERHMMGLQADMEKHDMSLQAGAAKEQGDMRKQDQAHEQKMAQINAQKEIALDKNARDEDQAVRLMREETARIQERNEMNAELDRERHEREMELKEKDAEAQRQADERAAETATKEADSDSSESQAQPMVINVHIDKESGKIKKTVQINRNDAGQAASLDIEEQASDG